MAAIERVINLERPLPFEVDVLACDPRARRHVFVDTRGDGALRCLCGERLWQEQGFTAIYYPCMPYTEDRTPSGEDDAR